MNTMTMNPMIHHWLLQTTRRAWRDLLLGAGLCLLTVPWPGPALAQTDGSSDTFAPLAGETLGEAVMGSMANYGPYTFTTLAGSAGNDGSADGTGSAARFYYPHGMAVDSAGNVYLAEWSNHTIRKVTPAGVVTTLAGSAGTPGTADGVGSAAHFDRPTDVAVDRAGNVFVADYGNYTIRKMSPAGAVTTLAGRAGYAGSADGTGSAARFYQPVSVAVDGEDNVLVADAGNHTIRKVTPAGAVTTFAGYPGSKGSADGKGYAARFSQPKGVAVDLAGNVFVADTDNHTIRKVTPAGLVTTLAGRAGYAGSADGTGSTARFRIPNDLAVDSAGNVYVADRMNHTIRKITVTGLVTTLAGSAGSYGSTDGSGSAARFHEPQAVAVDSAGKIFVADCYNHTVRKGGPATLKTYTFTTLAGSAGNSGSADGKGSAARFSYPVGLVVDSAGNVFVADTYNHTIRKVIPGGQVTTLAGLAGSTGSTDGTSSTARFSYPRGVAADTLGNVLVADTENHTIRKLTSEGMVTTLVGSAGISGSADGWGNLARFNYPRGVAVDSAGNPFVADTVNNTIRKVTWAGVVTTLAGRAGSYGSANGTGSAARFYAPGGLALDYAGNLYVADTVNATIRKVTQAGAVTTLAGSPKNLGSTDGTGSAARFNSPGGVAVDSAGVVFVADTDNHTIRKVTPAGVVTTLAGLAGTSGSSDGVGSAARFHSPQSVAVDSAGNVYVTDAGNATLRKGTLSEVNCEFTFSSPSAAFRAGGGSGAVTVYNPCGGSWTVENGASWIIVYTASFATTPGTVQYYVAPNYSGQPRSAYLTIAGQPFGVFQGPRKECGQLDFDGDGRADLTVYDPAPGTWHLNYSSGGSTATRWGGGAMVPVRGDFDGDGKSDVAAYYAATGDWYVRLSGGGMKAVRWGFSEAVPMPGDYDGDGRTDCAVYHQGAGDWYIPFSSGSSTAIHWGWSTAVPKVGDFDGDGKTDLAAYDPPTGDWYLRCSGGTMSKINWGGGQMQPLVGDFDGDGKSDLATYDPGSGWWYIRYTRGDSAAVNWGGGKAIPMIGDYDGDGKTDIVVYEAGSGDWYLRYSTGAMKMVHWGAAVAP